jgi:hypothetical protein
MSGTDPIDFPVDGFITELKHKQYKLINVQYFNIYLSQIEFSAATKHSSLIFVLSTNGNQTILDLHGMTIKQTVFCNYHVLFHGKFENIIPVGQRQCRHNKNINLNQ